MTQDLSTPVEVSEQSELCIICEGGIHTAEYLYANGVVPSKVFLNLEEFKKNFPTFTTNSGLEYLFIIRGMVDFTFSDFYSVLRDYKRMRGSYEKMTVISNLELGKVEFPYYLYNGDLFYGSVSEVVRGKTTPVLHESQMKKSKGKTDKGKSDKVTNPAEKYILNPVMERYRSYRHVKSPVSVYGTELRSLPVEESSTKRFFEAVQVVDYFK